MQFPPDKISKSVRYSPLGPNKIHEAADVLYHLIMYLEKSGIKIEDVMEELDNRRK